jgi:CarD family transcriptional regulator
LNFEVGDQVVYPPQGGGTIQEIVERDVLGKKQSYLKVVFVRGDMEVLVPLDRALEVGLRRTLTTEEFERLAGQVGDGELDLPAQWPPRYRAEQDILSRGDAFELARLVSSLTRRDLDRGLASTEREVLENARSLLASELAVVMGKSLAAGEDWIDTALLQVPHNT